MEEPTKAAILILESLPNRKISTIRHALERLENNLSVNVSDIEDICLALKMIRSYPDVLMSSEMKNDAKTRYALTDEGKRISAGLK